MKLIDQHMHTHHSFDSKESFENYIKQTDGYIITTEHLDFNDPAGNFTDRIPDYNEYVTEINKLNELYDNRILKGLELGWTKKDHQRSLDFIKDKYYDLILLSVHQNGDFDYLDPRGFIDQDIPDLIKTYIESLISALDHMHEHINILAHFDYGFRIHNIDEATLKTHGQELLTVLFTKLIEYDIALELNTSSMYRHNNLELYRYAIELYISLGGTQFALGSDAHFAKDYRRRFNDAKKLLLEFNIPYVVCYINKQAIKVKVAEI